MTQEYIEKRKSLSLIARELKCARSTVIDHLLKNGISLRAEGFLSNYNKSQLAYGKRLQNGQVVPHLGELRIIDQFQVMRSQGLSFGKIANWANDQKIPTKNKVGKWNRRTIFEILRRATKKVD